MPPDFFCREPKPWIAGTQSLPTAAPLHTVIPAKAGNQIFLTREANRVSLLATSGHMDPTQFACREMHGVLSP